MKVLAIAYDLPPTLAPQAIQIGRLLSHVGDDVELHVAGAEYATPTRLDAYGGLAGRFAGRVSVPSVFASRTLGLRMRIAPVLFKLPEPCAWDMRGLHKAILERWGSERFDWIWTFAYPFSSHVLGASLKEHFKCRWLAHTSDPWADNPLLGYGWLSGPYNAHLERGTFQAADRLVFVCEETRAFYAAKYPALATRMAAVEHSYDADLYPKETPAKNPVFTMRFIGNIYGGRSPETLLRALATLKQRWKLQFKLDIVLAYPRRLAPLFRGLGLETMVEARLPVDYLESLRLMKTSDLLLTFENPLPKDRFPKNLFLPSKVADYIGTGKPILALAGPGATRRVVEAYGGSASEPGDVEGLAKRIEEHLGRWQKGETPQASPAAAAYAAPVKAREFMELLK